MKAVQLLGLPWMAWSRRARCWIVLATVLLTGITVATMLLSKYSDTDKLRLTHLLATIDCLLWAFVLSRNLLLANEAHRLRLPTLGQTAIRSTTLYALLTVAVPATLLAALGADARVALAELALGAGLGMAYASLPLWLGFWACLAPMLDGDAGTWLPLPARDPSGFVHWAGPLAALLWFAVMLSWRGGQRSDGRSSAWSTRIVLRWGTLANRSRSTQETELLRRRRTWQQPTIDLRRAGPGQPLHSLRVALGGWSTPQTLTSRLRQLGQTLFGIVFVLAVLFAVLFAMRYATHGSAEATVYGIMLSLLAHATSIAFGFSLFAAMLGFVNADRLRVHWSRSNAELAVLAMLPGLGDSAQARRNLLQASLLPMLAVQATLLIGMLGIALWQGLPAENLALLLLAQGSAMFATVALGVPALAGTALRPGWQSALTIGASVLIITTSAAALFRFGDKLLAEPAASLPFALLWAALIAYLAFLGRRGWRAFQRRPHPFLPVA